MKSIHIKAVQDRLAMNDEAAVAGARRYYGRSVSTEWPPPIKPDGEHIRPTQAIRRLLRQGDLAPGDAATAAWAGVPFAKASRPSGQKKKTAKRVSTAQTKE